MRKLSKTLLLAMAATLAITPAFAEEDDGSSPPWSQADEYYGREAMSKARADVQHEAGGQTNWFVMADRFETQIFDDEEALVFDAQGWYGGDINKLWVKAEAEYSFEDEDLEDAEIQALWSRAIAPYFDVQAGLRYDLEPKGRTHAVDLFAFLVPLFVLVSTVHCAQEPLEARRQLDFARLQLGCR